jgi:hypothetical protein
MDKIKVANCGDYKTAMEDFQMENQVIVQDINTFISYVKCGTNRYVENAEGIFYINDFNDIDNTNSVK